jgi:chorismate mutase
LNDFNLTHPICDCRTLCAETEEQVLKIAWIERFRCKCFRAGIWKPRTRPGGFEGVGEIGLKWLKKQKKEDLMGTEVAKCAHVN